MALSIQTWARAWTFARPMVLSRGALADLPTLQVRITDENGHVGRGEGCGIAYAGETPATMAAQIENIHPRLAAGASRRDLLELLPNGGARAALDAALWDLEVKISGTDPFLANGLLPAPVTSAYTIGVSSLREYENEASAHESYPLLKIKVDGVDPVSAIQAVRRGAPQAKLIVDANQAWDVADLKRFAPALAALNVGLLEQPIRVGDESLLDGWMCPIPLCADELINTPADLPAAEGRFQYVNIKLDKTGGLTAAMQLADAVESRRMGLMVGCMFGSSLAMAPAMVLAQRCAFVDLDGPMLHAEDVENGFDYVDGTVALPHKPKLWG